MKRASSGWGIAVAAILLLTTSWAVSAGVLPAGATTPQPLTGVRSVTIGPCALLISGKVDCWGDGEYAGELGDGAFNESAVPVAVKGVGGTGTLGGVASLTSEYTNCALLISSKVDCWGYGGNGDLGNGKFYNDNPGAPGVRGSALPVAVKGVGGTGTLGGVASLTSDGGGYCALSVSGKVDCWGYGTLGELGNGTFYDFGNQGSAVPVAVKGVGGTGTLGNVASLTSDLPVGGYCALLISGSVDCWGYGGNGELGNGTFYTNRDEASAVPVVVKGVGGTGTLGNVASLSSGNNGYCAVLTSGNVDCWGEGQSGELGNGMDYSVSPHGSAVPVSVQGVGGIGTLGGVASIIGESLNTSGTGGYCARLTSGKVDCWGYGFFGQLGNGTFYSAGNRGSPVPVAVKAVGGTGTLGGVASLDTEGDGFCARLTSGKVDCWGYGVDGELGNGTYYSDSPHGSAVPVAVEGLGGSGTLGGVASVSGDCALLTSSKVDCWGYGAGGELGNGTFHRSAVPVAVTT